MSRSTVVGGADAPLPDRALVEASDWFAALNADHVPAAEQRAWQDWLARSPEHRRAWAAIESVSARLRPLQAGTGEAALAAARGGGRRGPPRRQAIKRLAGLGGLGVAALTGGGGVAVWRSGGWPALLADQSTGIGERRDLTLADGTKVWLHARSALNIAFTAGERRVSILAGEVFFDTHPDPARRAFRVTTPLGELEALGTRFDVRVDAGKVRLDVFEGAVAVRRATGAEERVAAGEHMEFDRNGVLTRGIADAAREAWPRGVLLARGTRLADLAAEIGRLRPGVIRVSPAVADLPVIGVFPADDPDRALDMLAASLPVRVRRTVPWWVSIDARP